MVSDAPEKAWRAEFAITERLNYLNNCSLTPLHRRGRERIDRYMTEWTEQGGRAWYDHWIGEYEAFREELAGVLGASADEVAIEPNVSAGLVGIASTFDYGTRPRVIVSDLDFPTDGHAFLAVADRGARVEFVRSPDRVRVPLELFERTVDERTAAVCTGHVYFTTGWIQDVRALAASSTARRRSRRSTPHGRASRCSTTWGSTRCASAICACRSGSSTARWNKPGRSGARVIHLNAARS